MMYSPIMLRRCVVPSCLTMLVIRTAGADIVKQVCLSFSLFLSPLSFSSLALFLCFSLFQFNPFSLFPLLFFFPFSIFFFFFLFFLFRLFPFIFSFFFALFTFSLSHLFPFVPFFPCSFPLPYSLSLSLPTGTQKDRVAFVKVCLDNVQQRSFHARQTYVPRSRSTSWKQTATCRKQRAESVCADWKVIRAGTLGLAAGSFGSKSPA